MTNASTNLVVQHCLTLSVNITHSKIQIMHDKRLQIWIKNVKSISILCYKEIIWCCNILENPAAVLYMSLLGYFSNLNIFGTLCKRERIKILQSELNEDVGFWEIVPTRDSKAVKIPMKDHVVPEIYQCSNNLHICQCTYSSRSTKPRSRQSPSSRFFWCNSAEVGVKDRWGYRPLYRNKEPWSWQQLQHYLVISKRRGAFLFTYLCDRRICADGVFFLLCLSYRYNHRQGKKSTVCRWDCGIQPRTLLTISAAYLSKNDEDFTDYWTAILLTMK